MKKTLEQLLESERKYRKEDGIFGINACKESILFEVEFFKKDLVSLLYEYVERANNDILFNKAMVLACWELIYEK